MLNVDGTTSKGRQKVDLCVVEEVVVLALESLVGLLLNFEHHVTRQHAGQLVTLTAELDLVAVLDTPVDVDVQNLPLDNGLLALATLAAVAFADDLSLTVAVWADGLEALDHGSHLAHHGLHTGTVTASAWSDCTLFASASIASLANDRLLKRKLRHLAAVDVLQADLVNVVDGSGFLGALVSHATAEHTAEGTSAAEELGEEVLRIHSASGTAAFQTLLTILVIDLALLRIG